MRIASFLYTGVVMDEPEKPKERAKTFLVAFVLLGFAAWELHDGMYSLRTGKPVMVKMHRTNALESFAYGAAAALVGAYIFAVAMGWMKSLRKPPQDS